MISEVQFLERLETTMSRFLICIALTFIISCNLTYADDGNEVPEAVELTPETFEEAVKEKNVFVKFFAPWCGHCKRLHPIWESLAKEMKTKEDLKVIVAKVDCTQHQELCSDHKITGYPTLKFFKLGEEEPIKFKGSRDMTAMTEFIINNLKTEEENEIPKNEDDAVSDPDGSRKLLELTEENFAKHISTGNHFVKFYAPWCSHCQRLAPIWDELAKTLNSEEPVTIAKVDCTQHRSVCQDFEVKGYPTLLWIEDGKKIEKYSGGRDLESLNTYIKQMLGTDTKATPPTVEEKKSAEDNAKVLELTSKDFVKTIEDGVTFVKFYAPWCGHCQKLSPIWDQLAEKMHSSDVGIRIAKVDCAASENKDLCVEQQIEGYPSLFAFKNGEKQSEYDGSRSLAELQHYIYKFIGHDEL